MSTHEKDKSTQESTHAADLQGFEDDKPYTAGLGAFFDVPERRYRRRDGRRDTDTWLLDDKGYP